MKIHIVQKGDTLWKIAQKYGVDFQELKKLNSQLSNPDLIMPGMKIKIPTGDVPIKKEVKHELKKEVPKVAFKKEAKEHPFAEEKPVAPIETEEPEAKEKPSKPYVPPVPKVYQPYYPKKTDVSNYFMLNMPMMNIHEEAEKAPTHPYASKDSKPQLPKKPENVFHEVLGKGEENKEEDNKDMTNPQFSNVNPYYGAQWQPYYAPVWPNIPNPAPNQFVSPQQYDEDFDDDDEYDEAYGYENVAPNIPPNIPPNVAPNIPPNVSPIQYSPQPVVPYVPYPVLCPPFPFLGCHPVSPVYPGSGLAPTPYAAPYGIPHGQWVSPEAAENQEFAENIPHTGAFPSHQDDCGCGGPVPYGYRAAPFVPYGIPHYPYAVPYYDYNQFVAPQDEEDED